MLEKYCQLQYQQILVYIFVVRVTGGIGAVSPLASRFRIIHIPSGKWMDDVTYIQNTTTNQCGNVPNEPDYRFIESVE